MSQLSIKDREVGDVTILDLSGKITIGDCSRGASLCGFGF